MTYDINIWLAGSTLSFRRLYAVLSICVTRYHAYA